MAADRAEGAKRRRKRTEPLRAESGTIRALAMAPFSDAVEISRFARIREKTCRSALRKLKANGLAFKTVHAGAHTARTARWALNGRGVERFAAETKLSVKTVLAQWPVSKEWIRILTRRMDALTAVYRVASSFASVTKEKTALGLYRSGPWDGVLAAGGSTLAILRMGALSSVSVFSSRLWTYRRSSQPNAALIIAPTEADADHWARRMANYQFPMFVASEQETSMDDVDSLCWRFIPDETAEAMSVRRIAEIIAVRGEVPVSPRVHAYANPPPDKAEANAYNSVSRDAKAVLNEVARWPLAFPVQIRRIAGVSAAAMKIHRASLKEAGLLLEVKVGESGERPRLTLSADGVRALAWRDRISTGSALKRLNPERFPETGDFRGAALRAIAKELGHNDGVHAFLTAMRKDAEGRTDIEAGSFSPPINAARYFREDGNLRSVNPDACGIVVWNGIRIPFALEWERRAKYRSKGKSKVVPYAKYHRSGRPYLDFGSHPLILYVFESPSGATEFWEEASDFSENDGRELVAFGISTWKDLRRKGVFGEAWMTPLTGNKSAVDLRRIKELSRSQLSKVR